MYDEESVASVVPTTRLASTLSRRLAVAALLAVPIAPAASAQTTEPVAVLSLDSAALAQVFELRVRVHVPEGSAVYFPDTIQATSEVESFAPVAWRAERVEGGGAELTLTYPVIPFAVGSLVVPGVDVVVTPAPAGADGAELPGGSRVGAWSDVPRGFAAGIVRSRVSDLRVQVGRVFSAEEVAAGVSPRGPDDVLGPSWSPWTIFFLTIFGAIFVSSVAPWVRSVIGRAAPPHASAGNGTLTPEEARLAALAELERIAATTYAVGAERQLFTATSGAVRSYVERLDPDWGPGHTSTELMDDLALHERDGRALVDEMRAAERVKFGRHRAGESAFRAHLATLKAWLGGTAGRRT